MEPFAPGGDTASLSVSTTSARVEFNPSGKSKRCRIYNSGSAAAFIAFGGSAVTAATTTGMPIAAGAIETFSCSSQSNIAAITASGTTTLYITPGEGV